MPPPEHPLPGPKPKPKPPKPKPPKPRPEPAHAIPAVPFPPDSFACASHCTEPCAYHRLCAPLPPPAATVHLRSSSRLPTPLIALSASVLAASAVLLLVLLACHLLRLRRRRQRQSQTAATPLTHHAGNAEAGTAPPALSENEDGEDGVHHVWYIRTVGLDERAIAAITALVYDSDKCRVGQLLGAGGDDGCAVCLAEFRDGETLRLLPRCGHAFHRGCIDVWLRAHVNCPLCRAPVTAKPAPAPAATLSTTPSSGGEAAPVAAADPAVAGGAGAEEEEGGPPEPAAVRRAVSMVALPRRAPWPEVSLLREPASNSGREGEMGLVKVSRVLKLSEALEMVGGGGRSMSFGSARLPARSGQPAATGDVNNGDETPR